jgi:hypothetical protein
MENNKMSNKKGLQKKSMLQQVMKPKDWVSLFVLIVISAVCWLWVLDAYQNPIDIDQMVGSSPITSAIDNNAIL